MAQIARSSQPGNTDIPAAKTIARYREVLSDLWILDPVEAWSPTNNAFKRLAQAEKHFLADPALAVRLLRLDQRRLLDFQDPAELRPRDGSALGPLFEALVALSLKTYAQANDANLFHFRTPNGNHEIDFVVVGQDGGLVAVEVKLASAIDDDDARHLRWLKAELGDELTDMVVIHTGPFAYRRSDGVAVVPLALLGP
jgi:predicted AAA+ superfamily ATPase